MKHVIRFAVLLIATAVLHSCSSTRHLKDGEYMLTKNTVKVTDRKGDEFNDLYYFLRPVPNKKFIDVFPIKTSLYATYAPKRDPETDTIVKDSKFRQWMRSHGEAPVLLDTNMVSYSMDQLIIAMHQLGYFNASVVSEVRFHRKKATVNYYVEANEPFFINKIKYHIDIPEYKKTIIRDTANTTLREGMRYKADALLSEKARILNSLRDQGYYYTPNNIVYFVVDTTQQGSGARPDHTVDIDIHINLSRVHDETALQKYKYKYEFNNVYIYSNYNPARDPSLPMDTVKFSRGKNDQTRYFFITPKEEGKFKKRNNVYVPKRDYRYRTLTDLMYTKRGDTYSQNVLNKSYKKLSDLKNFSYINIEFLENEEKRDTVGQTGLLNSIYKLSRNKIHAVSAEVDVRSDKANLSLTYSNKNIFKGAEYFNFNVYGGLDILFKRTDNRLIMYTQNAEAGGEFSLDFPRLFIFRKTQKIESLRYSTSIKLGAHWQRAATLYQRLILNTGITYNWTPNLKYNHSISPIDLSIVKIDKYEGFDDIIKNYSKAFQRKYEENVLFVCNYTFKYTHPTKSSRNSFTIRLFLESSGTLITGINALFKMPKNKNGAWTFCGMNYATYELAELDLRYSHVINDKNSVATRFNFGIGLPILNSKVLPFEKSFYLGGANSMRAWAFRTLGPGSYYSESKRTERSGDIKIEMNAEYRGTIYKFIKYGVFADAGNIWLVKKDDQMPNAEFKFNRFYNELALAAGVGLRLDFNFFIIRIDVALPIYDPNELAENRWINKNSFKKLYIPFAIGYAF